ncbi:hypothetical protein CB0940_09216 [Cercospora beticola]|uniref:Uncharacterized protein n=1 Tax=Cercospora beticola TaxID=122368 RepID=A0A2G5HGI1_CERBT|nr:hypothetical protein CB0940_09216 [Cercospora beticola]PIA91657.1 hypothetical protein CB0940_09216 [Cercospora beticola]WPB06482.1 hypothetical protein RHO25_011139 [Cercospora beticola]
MSSAVARVFATAELLETILTEVADLELSPAATEHDGFLIKAPFVKSVIGLQCVSHHSNNTIRGSSKLLKRRLEAAKIPGMLLTRIDFQLFGPMVWLTLQHHLQLSLIGVAYTDAQVATVTFRMNMDNFAEEWLSRRLEQSWRGIPCLTDPSRVSALQLKVLVSGFVSKMVGPFDMETSATLGDLVQMLLKIFTAEKPRLSRDAHQAQIFETLYPV